MNFRHWRIRMTAGYSATFLTIAEIEMRTSVGGSDVTGSGTASASSFFSGQPASNAFDNNAGSAWTSADSAKPQWIAYDFGAGNEVRLRQITMQTLATFQGRMPRDFEIQASNDGAAWTTFAAYVNEPAWSSGETRAFEVPAPEVLTGVALRTSNVDELAERSVIALSGDQSGTLVLSGEGL